MLYASLVGMVFATTIAIYLRLYLDGLPSENIYQVCLAGRSPDRSILLPGASLGALEPWFSIWIGCGKPYAATALTWALAGVSAVAGVTAVTYLVMPWWHIRRRKLQPLDRVRSVDLQTHLDHLVEQMGLASRPTFWLAPEARPQGVAFGRHGRYHVQLNAGLVKTYHTDRAAFTAVVLHELAHVRNRDSRSTYLTVATWWAFVFVALLPYILINVLRLISGSYGSTWVGVPSFNGRVVLSVLIMTVLIYLSYTAILRLRELHADSAAANVADNEVALSRILRRSRPLDHTAPGFWSGIWRWWQDSAFLRRHPSVQRRLTILVHPAPLYSTGTLAMVGAGIAIAVVQANLIGLAAQVLTVLTPAGVSGVLLMIGRIFIVPLVIYGVSAALIVVLACVTMWRARLRTYPESPPRGAWLRPAAALSAGLLVGGPLSVYYSGANVWGLFDGIGFGGAGVNGVVGAGVSGAALVFGIAVLFAWMSECAAVWIPVTRGSLWRVGLLACLVGTLAFGPAYAIWGALHDTGAVLTVLPSGDWAPQWYPEWVSSWTTPLVYAQYLPLLLVEALPGFGMLLALPCLFLIAGAARRPPTETPRWLRAAGAAAGAALPPRRPRTPVGTAIRIGLAGALGCLVVAFGLATLVWARAGRTAESNTGGQELGYFLYALVALAVAVSAIGAAIIVARTRQVGGTMAVLAALVTSGVVALATPFISIVALCGPSDVLVRAGCRAATADWFPVAYGAAMLFGVPQAVIAACLAGAVISMLSRLAGAPRPSKETDRPDVAHPDDNQPSRFKRAVLVALTAALVANLAIGGYVSYDALLEEVWGTPLEIGRGAP